MPTATRAPFTPTDTQIDEAARYAARRDVRRAIRQLKAAAAGRLVARGMGRPGEGEGEDEDEKGGRG